MSFAVSCGGCLMRRWRLHNDALRQPEVRGACPGALEPMESGDGLIVRVRPHAGVLAVEALAKIADAASSFGNGAIDLTRRANLQVRGLSQETLAPMRDVLAELGLLDESITAERHRNIMVSPLADAPTRKLARDLEAALARTEDLGTLSAKFGFVVEGGGTHLSLAQEASDIRLRFVSEDRVAVGLDMRGGTVWLGACDASEGAARALAIVRLFLATSKAKRFRDCAPDIAEGVKAALDLAPITPPAQQSAPQRLGLIHDGDAPIAVSLGAAFGRIDAADLQDFASNLEDLGISDVSLTPWRALVVATPTQDLADHVLAAGLAHGFLADDADPLTRIDACPGARACPCGGADTRAAARRLASLWPQLALTSAHVSGCTKGCARSEAADLVLVGRGDHFDIVRNGRADALAAATASLTLDGLTEALASKEG